MSPFLSPNIYLSNKWKKDRHRKHVEKVTSSQTKLDTKAPLRYMHLSIDLKRMQKEEEHQATVDYENRVLLQKLSSIMRNPCRVDNWNDYEKNTHRSLNADYRTRQEMERLHRNKKFVRRLTGVKPLYDLTQLETDFKKHKYMQQLKAESTKEYEINMDNSRRQRELDAGGSKAKLSESSRGALESASRSVLGETSEEAAEEGDQLGDLPSHSQKQPSMRRPKPKPKRLSEADENLLATYLMKSSIQTMAEYDAKLLYKVIMHQCQPTDIYIRTLVRRKCPQRMKTKKKFKELYDLELVEELHNALPSFSAITDVLFDDADSSATDLLHSAIEDGNCGDLINTFMNYESDSLKILRTKYKKKFGATMEAGISGSFQDPALVNFLTILLDALATADLTTDQLRAKENIAELQTDEDPFASDGTIIRVLEAHGPAQLALMNRCCREQNNGSITDILGEKEGTSLEATEAVGLLLDTFTSSAHLEGRARFLNSNMAAENRAFLAELCALSESPAQDQVHKEYRKLFKIPLMEDIARRCRGETTGIVMAMAENRRGPLSKGRKAKVKIEIVNAPPRRPNPDRTLTVDSGNPLYRPSQRHYADAAHFTLNQMRGRHDNASVASSRRAKPGDNGKKNGSIVTNPKFDPEAEAKNCRATLDDEEKEGVANRIGLLLTKGSNQQRQALRRKYKELYAKELLSDLSEVAAGPEWQRLLSLLLEPSLDSQVASLQEDITSGQSVAVLLSCSEGDLPSLYQKYKQLSGGTELLDDLGAASDFGRILSERLNGKREKSFAVNEEAVRKDAEALNQVETPIQLDNPDLTKLLKKSAIHICQTFELLGKRRQKSVKDVINEVFDTSNAPSMQNFIQGLANSSVVFAELLSDALNSQNNELLISITVSRSEIDMDRIKTTYKKIFSRNLYEQIGEEMGAVEWKETLLNVVKP